MVQVKSISKAFVDHKKRVKQAVTDFSFEAKPGQITSLLGVNGAGKTTTLRVLSTILKPDTGSASVMGFDVKSQPVDVRRNLGFLSNSTALYGRLSAREVLEYFGKLNGMGAELNGRINQISEQFGLGEFLDQLCDKLSTGQKQRVGVARAILHDPQVILLDEPTAGLDVLASQAIMEFIESLREQGKTVIFSTHIMSEVERLSDHVVVIHAGGNSASGTVNELKERTGQPTLEKAFLQLVGYKRGEN
ncbi:MAG: ATP-binding cassette domain-containing protein [Armatimonadetes bacterium]|nr:ATP-binding cassette domain-containing protein [Armatimonadota bacterium]